MAGRETGLQMALALLLLALAGCASTGGAAGGGEAGGAGTPRGMVSPERIAEMRALEAESAARLAVEGEALYAADPSPKNGYEYCGIALRLIEQGEFRRGIREASKALYLGLARQDAYLQAFAKRDLAYAYSLSGYLDRAEAFANDALALVASAPPAAARAPVIGPARKILGDIRMRQGRPADAIREYEAALAASTPVFQRFARAAMANAYLARRDTARARSLFAEAEPGASPTLTAMIRRGLGHAALVEGRAKDALQLFAEAAAQSTGPDRPYHRLWALEGAARAHLALGDRAAALGAYRQAMAGAEQVRARFRSEEFKAGFFGDMQVVFDGAVATMIDAGQPEDALEATERGRARGVLDLIRGRVVASAGADAFVDPLGRPASAAQLRGAVPEGVALVEYHVSAERTYAWVIGRSGIRAVTLPVGRDALAQSVARFRAAVRTRAADTAELSAALHRQLVQPLLLPPGEAIVVVPHDTLHYLPFQALRGPGGFLIEERAVSYAPSSSAAVRLLERGARGRERVLALGNPDVGSRRLALPFAQQEVERIRGLYPAASVHVQKDATKARLLAQGGQSELVHVAAHAEVDELDPLYSVIRLARADGVSGELEAHEVYRMELQRSSLVVLSACETGLGRVSRGDEIWGFTRSFLSAGAPALVVSLWPVEDESTARLMARLYEGLRGGQPVHRALQAAQVELLRDSRTRHPFFWAGFVLLGNWR